MKMEFAQRVRWFQGWIVPLAQIVVALCVMATAPLAAYLLYLNFLPGL